MNLTLQEVKEIQSNIRAVFNTPAGEKVMEFLEQACGWYESVFSPSNRDLTLINDGKRQVVGTLKTFQKFSPEEILKIINYYEE